MAGMCPKCRASVTDKSFYCPYCGAYLAIKTTEQQKTKTIWEMEAKIDSVGVASTVFQPTKPVWFIQCRNCGKKTLIRDLGNRPLACEHCGLDFDSLMDAPQKEQRGSTSQKECISKPDRTKFTHVSTHQSGPMSRKAVPDRTNLCLRSMNIPGELFPSSQQANMIGTGGNLSPAFFSSFRDISPMHCVIEHDVTGWYIRFFSKNSQYNGQWVDIGDQMPLRNGDFITLGSSCVLQVLISEIRGR